MSEISKYEAYKKKMQGLCDEHNLIFKFTKNTYPVTLTIKPTDPDDAQLTLLPDMNDKEISPDAFLMFEFKDGDITYKTSKEFVISETLFNKIKNLFKNMHSCWMQHFFRDIIERELLAPGAMPEIDEADADDTDIALPEGAEPIEEFIDDIPEDYITEAKQIVRMENKASTSLLMRRLNVDEEKAEQIMEALEIMGVVGPYNDGESREVLPYDEPDDNEDGADNE